MLKALPWDKVDIEVVMVELEHAGKVIFAFRWFLIRQAFGAQQISKMPPTYGCFRIPSKDSIAPSALSGVSRIKTGRASIFAGKRLRLCWITV